MWLFVINYRMLEWGDREKEWGEAKNKLLGTHGLLPVNGTKLRRKDSGLQHSFIVMDNQILAMDLHFILGKGSTCKVKLAEDEQGKLYALKVIPIVLISEGHKVTLMGPPRRGDEEKIAQDLGLAGKKSKRDSTVQTKEYLAYTFLGIALSLYYKLNKARLLNDDLYLLGIKMVLAVHALHTGQHSKTQKSYIHGDIHEGNIVVDKDDNPHIIDFDCTRLLTLQNQEQAVFDTQSLFSRCFYENHDGSPGIFGELNKDAAFNKLLINLLKIQPALKFAETLTLYRLGMDGIILEEASLSENQRLNRIKWLNALDKELFKLYATLGSNERKSEIQTIILQSLSHGAAIKFDSFLKQHPDASKELRSSLRQITKIQCKKEVIELVNVLRLVGNKTPQLNEFIESLVTLVETKINTPDLKRDMIVVFKVEYEQSIIAIQKEIESTKDPIVIHIFNAVKTAINALISVFYAFLNHTPYVRYNFLTIHSSSSIISQKVNEFKASLDGLCDTLLNDTLDEPEQYLEAL